MKATLKINNVSTLPGGLQSLHATPIDADGPIAGAGVLLTLPKGGPLGEIDPDKIYVLTLDPKPAA